jgi:hypothetical protein
MLEQMKAMLHKLAIVVAEMVRRVLDLEERVNQIEEGRKKYTLKKGKKDGHH